MQAKAALGTANTGIEGTIEMPGNPYVVAALNVELKGIGHFSGKYHLTETKHIIDRSSGYKTSGGVKTC